MKALVSKLPTKENERGFPQPQTIMKVIYLQVT